MIFSRTHLFQIVRWTFVSIAIVLSVWMLSAGVRAMFNTSISWTTPLMWFMILIFTAPLGMIAYFGIRGEYRRFFTTIIFLISFLIFIFSSSALSHVRFVDLISGGFRPAILEAIAGVFLSVLQVVAPFIPAVLFFRLFMKLLSKLGFPAEINES
jgi:hypothetical protein